MRKKNLVLAIDIGSSKVCALVARAVAPSKAASASTPSVIEVLGVGTCPARGTSKGVVINTEQAASSIQRAVQIATSKSGGKPTTVIADAAGIHLTGQESFGVVALPHRAKEIDQEDVEEVLAVAGTVPLPAEREVIHILPYGFIVDGRDSIKDPRGMRAVRLETRANVLIADSSALESIVQTMKRSGFESVMVAALPLTVSQIVLTDDERELGAAIIDIGGGLTDLAIVIGGSLRWVDSFNLAGDSLTKDVSIGLRTPYGEAEELKKRYGCLVPDFLAGEVDENPVGFDTLKNESIEVASLGEREAHSIERAKLAEIIELRMREILTLVHRKIEHSGYLNYLTAGVVLTGGTALLPGIMPLASELFAPLPVRLGLPRLLAGKGAETLRSPLYTGAVGLINYAVQECAQRESTQKLPPNGVLTRLFRQIGIWINSFF